MGVMTGGEILYLVLAIAFSVGVYVVLPYILIRVGVRYLRRTKESRLGEEASAALAERLHELEGRIETLSAENAQLHASQQFTEKLLATRPAAAPLSDRL